MKKSISVFLMLAILLTLCACSKDNNSNKIPKESNIENTSARIEKDELIYDSTEAFEYSEVEDGIVITHFTNYDNVEYDKIYVPNEIDGKKVVGIGKLDAQHRIMGAIYGHCEVILPDTVKYIANSAFNGADGLVKISGGENCTKIGEYAFMNCENLEEITFLDNVSDLADNAFVGCTKWNSNH